MIDFAFAARSHVRNAVLCGLLTFGLAACGADESSSSGSTPVASGSTPSLVGPSVGVIGRPGATTPVTNPAPSTGGSKGTTATPPSANTGNPPLANTGTPPPSNPGTPPPVNPGPPPVKASTGTATLDWTAPTENNDGSVLTNLAGYTVYYGTSAQNLNQSVKIPNPGLTAYTMTNLASGTWYFAVTAYSSTGVESVQSGVISTTI